MSLADYTGLKAEISDWLHRTDISSQADTFIDLFESDFNSNMRVRQMEQRTQLTSTAGYLLHPTNWIGWKSIRGVSGGDTYNLEPISEESAILLTGDESSSSTPLYYKTEGAKTWLYPYAAGVSLTVVYYEGVGLSTGTNWLLTAYPGAYLFGSLLGATSYISDDAQAAKWREAYDRALYTIKSDSRRSEWSGQVLQMKPSGRVV